MQRLCLQHSAGLGLHDSRMCRRRLTNYAAPLRRFDYFALSTTGTLNCEVPPSGSANFIE